MNGLERSGPFRPVQATKLGVGDHSLTQTSNCKLVNKNSNYQQALSRGDYMPCLALWEVEGGSSPLP